MSLSATPRASFKKATHAIHEMLGPGGYLNSQTTDTQYFDATEHEFHPQSRVNNDEVPHNDNDTFLDKQTQDCSLYAPEYEGETQTMSLSPSSAEVSPAPETTCLLPAAQIMFEDRRPRDGDDMTKVHLWQRLDAAVNGPDYGDGRTAPWFKFPTLRRQRPEVNYNLSMTELWRRRSSNESDLVGKHVSAVHRMAGASPYPPSILQGEFVFLADFLSHLFPMMVRAATESDLVTMQEMIRIGNDLLKSMQVLVDVEADAREEINRNV